MFTKTSFKKRTFSSTFEKNVLVTYTTTTLRVKVTIFGKQKSCFDWSKATYSDASDLHHNTTVREKVNALENSRNCYRTSTTSVGPKLLLRNITLKARSKRI
ncbi:unnamed protein product [Callosobruchus maculatus]|uniref:Uncharacterized protein n=1 Tax=Callosobruchus maculatus TaxID=64391 RepID=A0A653DD74_CALMS|nr:unnamed protein product [Callosobruchus maculatus]